MSYRSERFEAGELSGLAKAWETVDLFDGNGVPVVNEVMAGARYRRQLHEDAVAELGSVDYLLQVTLEPEQRDDGWRMQPRPFLDKAVELLSAIDLPGESEVDEGGLHGWDVTTTEKYPMGTGKTETEILQVYPPWLKASWEEAGKSCVFFCGIQPPKPKPFMEDWMFNWDERVLRGGHVVFTSTPDGLETW